MSVRLEPDVAALLISMSLGTGVGIVTGQIAPVWFAAGITIFVCLGLYQFYRELIEGEEA